MLSTTDLNAHALRLDLRIDQYFENWRMRRGEPLANSCSQFRKSSVTMSCWSGYHGGDRSRTFDPKYRRQNDFGRGFGAGIEMDNFS
jgi:hypothetical protein